jgi:hypothetical protein
MSPGPAQATDFEIKELVLESVNGIETDLLLQMAEINVYENLHNSCISADIAIDDALNQIMNLPITGHEWIRFSFKTPGQSLIKLHLRIYKISSRELEKLRRQVFVLHCIDGIEFENAEMRVSKAYKGKLISDIVTNIQSEYLGSSFNKIESTKNLFHIIPAYWTPIKTINFLASRANSSTYLGSNYVYYQTVDGFNFISIEKLCDTTPVQKYISQPANIREQGSVSHASKTINSDQVAIQSYKFDSNFDTLENITNGMYSNRLLWHDIRTKQFGETDFSYPGSYDNYKHIELNKVQGGSSRLWTSKSDFDNDVFGAFRFASTGMPNQESFVKQWLQQRISQMQQIQNVRMFATVPGDSNRRVGDIVEVSLPSPEAPIHNQLVIDKFYTNRYLISGLRHTINRKQYLTTCELIKDSVFQAYP